MKNPRCDNPNCEDGYESMFERPDGGVFCTHCLLCDQLNAEDEKELQDKVAAQDAKDLGTTKPGDARETKRKNLPTDRPGRIRANKKVVRRRRRNE